MHRKCFFVKYEIYNSELGEILNKLYEDLDFEFERSVDVYGNIQYEYSGMYCDSFRFIEPDLGYILVSLLFYEGRNRDKISAKKIMMRILGSIANMRLLSDEEILMDENFEPKNLN